MYASARRLRRQCPLRLVASEVWLETMTPHSFGTLLLPWPSVYRFHG